jgi:hypothetical protein
MKGMGYVQIIPLMHNDNGNFVASRARNQRAAYEAGQLQDLLNAQLRLIEHQPAISRALRERWY